MQSTAPRRTGRCLCGAIRFELCGPPAHAAFCHCTDCCAASGSGPMPWAEFPRAGFRWTRGEPKIYASSKHGRRYFCGECGAPLIIMDSNFPDRLDVILVALDEPEKLAPSYHIYWGSKPDWYEMGDDWPRFAGDTDAARAAGAEIPRHASWGPIDE